MMERTPLGALRVSWSTDNKGTYTAKGGRALCGGITVRAMERTRSLVISPLSSRDQYLVQAAIEIPLEYAVAVACAIAEAAGAPLAAEMLRAQQKTE